MKKILSVTYLAMMAAREEMRDKLRKDCVAHIASHLKEIDMEEIKKLDKEISLDVAVDVLIGCQKRFG